MRALALLFAASWISFPGWALPDLIASWSPEWPQVLEGGWGVYSAVLVAVPFFALALGLSSRAAVLQLLVADAAYLVASAAAREPQLLWLAALLGIETAFVAPLSRRTRGGFTRRASKPLLGLGIVGAVAWMTYALDMWAANRHDPEPIDVTMGIDHYAVQGALALALAVLPLLAAAYRQPRALFTTCAGVASAYLGLISVASTSTDARLSLPWALAAIAWGIAVAVLGLRHDGTHRRAATD